MIKGFFRKIIFSQIKANHGAVVYFKLPEQMKVLSLINSIRKEKELLLGDLEAYELYSVVRSLKDVEGDLAEVGCFAGASTKLILEASHGSEKKLFAFDTFEGLPFDDKYSTGIKLGDYASSFESFQEYLSSYSNLETRKGVFPDTATGLADHVFSFVHLDTDLYQTTLDGLRFFYPKLSKGGVIISHDYTTNQGVNKAFKEFCSTSIPVIEIAGTTQGLVYN